MNIPRVLLASAILLIGLACAEGERTTAADVEAINQVREREATAINEGDVDGSLAVYTDDCAFMPPNQPLVTGHEALRSWFEEFYGQFDAGGEYTSSDVVVAGDWAIERYAATFTLTPKAGGESVEEPIKGIHIYSRQPDGSWLIAQDMWSSDNPPMVAQ